MQTIIIIGMPTNAPIPVALKAAPIVNGLKKAEIEDFRFHDLRHTAATRMADSGTDVFTLAKILGHSDITMTNRYTHATDSAIRNAVANLETNSDFGNELVTKEKRAS